MSKETVKFHLTLEVWKYVQNNYYCWVLSGRYPSGTRMDRSYIFFYFPFLQHAKQSIFTRSTEAKRPHTRGLKLGSLETIILAIYYPSWQFHPLTFIKKSVLLLKLLLRYEMNYNDLRISYISFNIFMTFYWNYNAFIFNTIKRLPSEMLSSQL